MPALCCAPGVALRVTAGFEDSDGSPSQTMGWSASTKSGRTAGLSGLSESVLICGVSVILAARTWYGYACLPDADGCYVDSTLIRLAKE